MKSRALLVQRGSPPSVSVVSVPQAVPDEGEVLVQVQAAALTPTDVLLCSKPQSLIDELVSLPATSFVPGLYFFGEVLSAGRFVDGIVAGEPVLGLVSGISLGSGSEDDGVVAGESERRGVDVERSTFGGCRGGCYREAVRVPFSNLIPMSGVLPSSFHIPSVIAHLPPMVNALFCVASHLRLRAMETLLLIVPRLADVIFLLQRLLLISDAWIGPLYLVVLHGNAPTREELEKHPLLQPLLLRGMHDDHSGNSTVENTAGPLRTFLDEFTSFSVEENLHKMPGAMLPPEQMTQGITEIVHKIVDCTQGAGLDVILALDVDLSPPTSSLTLDLCSKATEGDCADGQPIFDHPPQPPALLRKLIGALALRGRLITNSHKIEMTPADSEHLWAKEGGLSVLNPHCLPLSGARHGVMLHAIVEVVGRIASVELPVAESEVLQYRLFEQFHLAYEASSASSSRNAGGHLIVLLV